MYISDTTPRNRTEAPGSKGTPRVKICILGADRAANRNITWILIMG